MDPGKYPTITRSKLIEAVDETIRRAQREHHVTVTAEQAHCYRAIAETVEYIAKPWYVDIDRDATRDAGELVADDLPTCGCLVGSLRLKRKQHPIPAYRFRDDGNTIADAQSNPDFHIEQAVGHTFPDVINDLSAKYLSSSVLRVVDE